MRFESHETFLQEYRYIKTKTLQCLGAVKHILTRGLKSYIIPRHKLDFLRSQILKKSICGGHFKFQ